MEKIKEQFVLLKGKAGNVFWTTDDGSKHEGFIILYKGTTVERMIKEWEKYHPNFNFK